MSKKKSPQIVKKNEVFIVRSSAAEYLTFIAASGQGGVEAVYADESIWLTRKMMGLLYDVETHTINYHLKKVFSDSELEEGSVIRNFRIAAADGKSYDTKRFFATVKNKLHWAIYGQMSFCALNEFAASLSFGSIVKSAPCDHQPCTDGAFSL